MRQDRDFVRDADAGDLESDMRIRAHSTRLFPKDRGTDAYRLTGIASHCDWVLLTDVNHPRTALRRRDLTGDPKTIFVSLREPNLGLGLFAQRILPELQQPVVLVTGSKDLTIPNQIDTRARRFNADERAAIEAILASPKVLHWFAENLDDPTVPKLSPLPVGLIWETGETDEMIEAPLGAPLSQRKHRVLCAHRVRSGVQWDTRRNVTAWAQTGWSDFATVIAGEIAEDAYLQTVADHCFVLCVTGGGIDPCPKLWQTLQYGAIPIIENNGTAGAYRNLPVAIVDKWSPDALTPERLQSWRLEFEARFDTAEQRAVLAHQLSLDYWWTRIQQKHAELSARL